MVNGIPEVNSTGTGRRVAKRREKRRIAFGWYGGKFSHLDFLTPLLPKDAQHFCDLFGGSASVLMNIGPYPVETYNDLDTELVNFFRTLRNNRDDLIKAIGLTPFSREELLLACRADPNLSDLERARRFYVRARQTRTGLAQTSSAGRWAHCVLTSRAGMAGAVSRWLGSVEGLSEIAQRLLRVQIDNRPASDVIRLYDSPQTLFYCDPPYLHATRGDAKAYGFEMDETQHREFAEIVNACSGMVAVSGYAHPLMDALFEPGKWFKTLGHRKTIHSTKGTRQEVLWTNYDPQKQMGLFE